MPHWIGSDQERIVGCVLLVLTCASPASPTSAGLVDAYWTDGGAPQSYSDPANWDILIEPCNGVTEQYSVHIAGDATPYDVNLDSSCMVTSLTIGSNGAGDSLTIFNHQALLIDGGILDLDGTLAMAATPGCCGNFAYLEIADGTTITGNGTIFLSSTLANQVFGADLPSDTLVVSPGASIAFTGGQLDLGAGAMALVNQGTLNSKGAVDVQINVGPAPPSVNTGIIRASEGGKLTFAGGSMDNATGVIEARESSVIDLDGGTVIGGVLATEGDGIIRVPNHGTGFLGGDVELAGTLKLAATPGCCGNFAHLKILDGTRFTGDGVITATETTTNQILGASLASDTLTIDDEASLTFIAGQVDFGATMMAVVNQGLFDVGEAAVVRVGVGGVVSSVNTGTMQASNTGTLVFAAGTIDNSNGTVQALDASIVDLDGGIIHGGALSTEGSGVFRVPNHANGFLSGQLALDGTIEMDATPGCCGNFAVLNIKDGTTFTGTTVVLASETLTNSITGADLPSDRLTIAPGASISFLTGSVVLGAGAMALTNEGLIDVGPAGNLSVRVGLAAPSVNVGIMRASNGGILTFAGGTIDNTSGSVRALDASFVDLAGGTLQGGAFVTEGTGMFRVPNSSDAYLAGEIDFNGTLRLDATPGCCGNYARLWILDGTSITGVATFSMTDTFSNTIAGAEFASDTLTITQQGTLTLVGGKVVFGDAQMTLINHGTIVVNGAQQVDLSTTACWHEGVFRVIAGGLLNVVADITGGGSWEAENGKLLIGAGAEVDGTGSATISQAGEVEIGNGAVFAVADLALDDSSTLDVNGTGEIVVAKDFAFAIQDSDGWQWAAGSTLRFESYPTTPCEIPGTIEAGGPDFKIPNLVVAPGARVRVVDVFDNVGLPQDPEALHVGTLTFEDGAGLLILDGLELSYDSLVGDPGQIRPSDFIVKSSDPPGGAIDARQPSDPSGDDHTGWNSFAITYCGNIFFPSPDDFSVCELGGDGIPPEIIAVELTGLDSVQVTLDGIIEPGAWTCITHVESSATVTVGYLPADVNNDGISNGNDILQLLDFLNDVAGPFSEYQTDVDRSGKPNPNDVLRAIDLLNGAGAYEMWFGATLPG